MIHPFSHFFLKRKKASFTHYTFALENQTEVWLSGRKRHTANVLNRQVPEVRILLLPLIRLVSSVGSEHDATNVGVGSSSLSRVTEIYLDIVFNGSIRSLGDCGVSSSLAIQKAFLIRSSVMPSTCSVPWIVHSRSRRCTLSLSRQEE